LDARRLIVRSKPDLYGFYHNPHRRAVNQTFTPATGKKVTPTSICALSTRLRSHWKLYFAGNDPFQGGDKPL
jgi:hypothetical protein